MAEDNMTLGYLMGNSENKDGGWGGFGEGLWAVIILAILFGRGGLGGFGGFGGGGGEAGWATQADVRAAVDQQTLISKLDQQTYGLADSTYALNNTLVNGFHGVDNAICNLGYQTQTGFNAIGNQISSCCCDIGRQIERGFCDTNANIANQTRSIIDFLVQDKMETLRSENDALRLKASQTAQNQYLIDQLRPSPVPAYITCSPFASSYGFGFNNGCGCGCN